VGHTASSDLDYWVCYNPEKLNGFKLELFQKKLATLTQWARLENLTEANFYLVDLAALENGFISSNFGDHEIEGEVAPNFLLEELYRTMVFVAGRMPLWTIWPLELPESEDHKAALCMAPLKWEENPPSYVDMGFPKQPSPQEYLAAAMWLTCKSEAAPFKGIIKIVPILEALETNFTAPLLCNTVKQEIILNENPNLAVDPYILTVERVIDFGATKFSQEHLDLIRDAAILKVLGLTGKQDPSDTQLEDPVKFGVISRWIKEWGWTSDRLTHLLDYNNWSDRERLTQGNELLLLLFSIYMDISNHLMTQFPDQVNAQDEQLTPFAARILGRQKGLEATVDLLPSQFHRDSLSRCMAMVKDSRSGYWILYNYSSLKNSCAVNPESWDIEKNCIYESYRAVKTAAWLSRNQLSGEDFSLSFPLAKEGELTQTQFQQFLNILDQAFPPVSFRELDPENIWYVGAQGSVLVTFNFEIPKETSRILTLDVIFRTGWGEMRHVWQDVSHLKVEADKYLQLSSFLLDSAGITDPKCLIHGDPNPSNSLRRAFLNLKSAFMASLYRAPSAGETRSLIDL
jgi:adenylate cyclase class 1